MKPKSKGVPIFNKDGSCTKRAFRVYCEKKGCNEHLIGKWGGGYGGIVTKVGTFDWRNQCWYCKKHRPILRHKQLSCSDKVSRCDGCGKDFKPNDPVDVVREYNAVFCDNDGKCESQFHMNQRPEIITPKGDK